MRRLEIFRLLDVRPAGVLISKFQVTDWGRTVKVECLYDPDDPKPFAIIFRHVREFHWEWLQEPSDELHDSADVIAIQLGQGKYKELAVVHTLEFELRVSYQEVELRKLW